MLIRFGCILSSSLKNSPVNMTEPIPYDYTRTYYVDATYQSPYADAITLS